MEKSMIYKYAQCAIIEYDAISTRTKLEILKRLMADESLAKYAEDLEANEVAKNEAV